MKDTPLDQLTPVNFSRLLNLRFRVCLDAANTLEAELIEVTPGHAMKDTPYENFSLLFNGPRHPVLPQGIYGFEQDNLGRFELFIVPVGQNQNGTQYQAVFNRLVKPG
ncbi:MAG TPA: hypothetical protein VGN23_12445 [Verrucomicrobiae bacterium]|jgi:hypothetical protein